MKEKDRIDLQILIKKYMDGKASQEEIDFINLYYDSFEVLSDELSQKSEEDKIALQTEIKHRILDSVAMQEAGDKTTVAHRPLYRPYRIAAAAVLLIGFILFYFLYPTIQHTETAPIAASEKVMEDIQPGADRATLQLADGSIIDLEKASVGELFEQDNGSFVKTNEGQLSYNLSKNETATKAEFNTVITPRKGKYQLVLADGSKVWLNASSSIRFPTVFSDDVRQVEIRGEAYFEIAHNKSKPFLVQVNDTQIEVLGTRFNVNSYEDERVMKTTLLEGSVKVKHQNSSSLLVPGEEASIRKNNARIAIKSGVNLKEAIAWKDGYFQFNDADIETIMRQLARWYDLKVAYEGEIPKIKFKGKIQRDLSLSAILEFLKTDIHFERNGNTITIKHNSKNY